MKIMSEQKIYEVSATSEEAAYPIENIIDEHPKKMWKASGNTVDATITLTIYSNNSGLAIFNTNAQSIDVTVTDPNNILWESGVAWETGMAWTAYTAAITENLSLDSASGAAWFEWNHSTSGVIVTLELSKDYGEALYIGVAVADEVNTFACPSVGVVESMRSYSIVRELQNGAMYRKERDKVRTFDMSVTEDRAIDFYSFMYSIARDLGYKPAAWQIADIDDFWWVVYARFNEEMPAGIHSMPNHSDISIQLIEVL